MAWTYAAELISNRKDRVRFLLGDTDPEHEGLQDEEIEWTLSIEPNIYFAAARCGEALIARWQQKFGSGSGSIISKTVGKLSISYSSAQSVEDAYRKYLQTLRERGSEVLFGDTPIFKVI